MSDDRNKRAKGRPRLRRESLRVLDAHELDQVLGGVRGAVKPPPTSPQGRLDTRYCL